MPHRTLSHPHGFSTEAAPHASTAKKPAAAVDEAGKSRSPKRKAKSPAIERDDDNDNDDEPAVTTQEVVTPGAPWDWGTIVGAGITFRRAGSNQTWVCTHELGTGDVASVYAVQCGESVGALKLFDHSHGLQKKTLEQSINKSRISSHNELFRYKQVAGIDGFPSLLDPVPADIRLFAKDPFTGWEEPGFFVMQRVGPSIESSLKSAPLTTAQAQLVGVQVLATLERLHTSMQLRPGHVRPALGYMDLKPENVCWGYDPATGQADKTRVFLIDLGTCLELGFMAAAPGTITQGNVQFASYSYIAKESGYSRADDLEALGLLLAHAMGFSLPWGAADVGAALVAKKKAFPGAHLDGSTAGRRLATFITEVRQQGLASPEPDYAKLRKIIGALAD